MVEERAKEERIIYTVPPTVDAKTWAEVQLKQAEVELKKFEKLYSLGLQIVEACKEYHLKKSSRIIISAYIIV